LGGLRKGLKDTMLRYFLPVLVDESFILLGIYAKDPKLIKEIKYEKYQYEYQYMGQIREYLKNNKEKLIEKPCIATGDFNDNYSFDRTEPSKEFLKNVIKEIEDIGLKSLYHVSHKINIGEEGNAATRYDKNRPTHIDYCFVSERFQSCRIKIAEENEWDEKKKWKDLSDHCPLIIEI
jgi:exonuclease III